MICPCQIKAQTVNCLDIPLDFLCESLHISTYALIRELTFYSVCLTTGVFVGCSGCYGNKRTRCAAS